MRALRRFLSVPLGATLRLVSPPRCAACDAPLPEETLFCEECEPQLAAEANARVDRLECGLPVVSTGLYAGALAAAVQALKYRNRPDLGRLLGRRLAGALGRAGFCRGSLLVPVPLHPARLAKRGYNQSALVADAAARTPGLACDLRALVRTRVTGEQATLTRRDRLVNVEAAFAARRPLHGRSVLLVDDVVTTGATALACVAALAEAGALVVGVAALARADRVELR